MILLGFRLNYKNVSIVTQCLIVLEILEDVVKCTLGTPSGTLTRYPGDNSICLVKYKRGYLQHRGRFFMGRLLDSVSRLANLWSWIGDYVA